MLKKYLDYIRENPKRYWFKRKLYGWGWVPARIHGWLVILLYIAVLVYLFRKTDALSHSGSDTLIGLVLPFIALTTILLVICYVTGETPRWQWGEKTPMKERADMKN